MVFNDVIEQQPLERTMSHAELAALEAALIAAGEQIPVVHVTAARA